MILPSTMCPFLSPGLVTSSYVEYKNLGIRLALGPPLHSTLLFQGFYRASDFYRCSLRFLCFTKTAENQHKPEGLGGHVKTDDFILLASEYVAFEA